MSMTSRIKLIPRVREAGVLVLAATLVLVLKAPAEGIDLSGKSGK